MNGLFCPNVGAPEYRYGMNIHVWIRVVYNELCHWSGIYVCCGYDR